jgi:S1-C subfamily serine protease
MFRLPYSLVRVTPAARLSSSDSARSRGAGRGTVRLGVVAAGTVALLLFAPPVAVRADLREAARKLVPATVVITRIEHSQKAETSSTKTPAGVAATQAATKKIEPGKAGAYWNQSNPQLGLPFTQNLGVDAINVWCGVVIRSDGWIVTTSGGAASAELEVRLTDGRAFPARLVVDDRRTGLWLLKAPIVETPSISVATMPVELGQDLIAAMMDGPKSRQIARGIVTALNRHVDGIPLPLILTDLPMREAAAGAPVSNTQGELVGLVSARGQGNDKHTHVVTAANVKDLFVSRRNGAVITIEPGMLGISVGEPGDDKLMVVNGVNGGGPAEKAGLQKGDRVESIDGRQFNSPEELMEYVGMKSPGSAVVIKYRRGEKDFVAAAVLAARPAPTLARDPNTSQNFSFFITNPNNGVSFTEATVTNPNYGLILTSPDNGLTIASNGLPNNDLKTGVRFGLQLAPAQTAPQAVVRVEKTDVEKRIDELRHDVGALTKGIDSIRSHLDKLGADLKALSESRSKK